MNIPFDLNTLWFILIGVLLAGYAILDGFDLGVGGLFLWIKGDQERRILLNAIGPVWDGNEVWLVTAGGALFAAFPVVYATVFSGFYLAFILLLFSLIFRAVAIEFRGKESWPWWKSLWDNLFSLGSLVATLLFGVALGNMAWGIPLDEKGEFIGTFFSLLNPYALLVGVTTLSLFIMHGALFLLVKTEDDLQQKLTKYADRSIIVFVVLFMALTVATFLFVPHLTRRLISHPILFGLPLLTVIFIGSLPRLLHRAKYFRAFLCSSATIALLMLLFGLGTFPYMVYSPSVPINSLTIYNASSSGQTLKIMLIITLIGFPLVLAYTSILYWIFRGKVKLGPTSY